MYFDTSFKTSRRDCSTISVQVPVVYLSKKLLYYRIKKGDGQRVKNVTLKLWVVRKVDKTIKYCNRSIFWRISNMVSATRFMSTLFFFLILFLFSFPKDNKKWGPDWEQSRQDRRDRPGGLHRRVKRTYVRRPGKQRDVFSMTCGDWTGTVRGEYPPRNTRRGNEHEIYW